MRSAFLIPPVLGISSLLGGCGEQAQMVRVVSDPPGAKVIYGSAGEGYKESYGSFVNIHSGTVGRKVFVQWPDGLASFSRTLSWESPSELIFRREDTLARLAENHKPTVTPETPAPPPEPLGPVRQRWAVVIGVSKYRAAGEQLRGLDYADKDAGTFRDFLVSQAGGGFPASHVLLLTNERATTAAIRKAMFRFLKEAIKEDLVVIYFSGHGAADPDRPKNLYLLTYDTDPADIAATAFPMDDVRKALRNTVEAQRVVVLADACHSGGVAQATAVKGVRVGETNEAVQQYWAELAKTAPGRVIFTSSERTEVSQESAQCSGGHGVFTWALLAGLKGAADYDANGIVTLGEAIRYTDEKVRRETKSAPHPSVAGEQYDPNLPMGVVK